MNRAEEKRESLSGDDATPSEDGKKDAGPPREGWFTFTKDGCHWTVRLGLLMMLAAVFLWLYLGPLWAGWLFLCSTPFLVGGVPFQAWQARTVGRPGYPLKVGVIATVLGVIMWYDLSYREFPDGPLQVQATAPILLVSGLWILGWWPLCFVGRREGVTVDAG